jgi:hypothetical protein
MITFIKKNLAVLLIGAILGASISAPILYGAMSVAHNRSKRKTVEAYNVILKEKNALISECIKIEKTSNTVEFNPEIGKNKKGQIIIETFPKIDQQIKPLERSGSDLIKQTIQNPKSEKEVIKKEPIRRGKGNW